MASARALSLDRSKSLLRERALGDDLVSLAGQEEGVETEVATPYEDFVAGVQGRFGNDMLQQSLFGAGEGGLGSMVLADFAMASVGVAGTGLIGASNTAMLSLMREFAPGKKGGASEGERVNRALQRGGRALPADLQSRLESAFGISLQGVEVHDDAAAADASEAVNAHAFTIGTDIFFGRGEFAPGTHEGDELIAHEVTHAVQHLENRAGRPTSVEGDVAVTRPTDAVEQEAYAFGAAFAEGKVGAETVGPAPAPATEVAAPSAGAAEVAAVARDAKKDKEGEQTEQREPTAEELSAMDKGESSATQGKQQGENAADTPPVPGIPEEDPTKGGPGPGPSGGQDDKKIGMNPSLSAPNLSPNSGSAFDPSTGSPIVQYMAAVGPQENQESKAAEELAGSSWNLVTDGFGPLVAYDRERGGFDFKNLWGVAKQMDTVFATGSKERGEGGLASTIEVLDTIRSVAEGVGSVAGAIGTTCGILSLIGLIPPLAPVGAVLLSVAGVCTQIAFWSTVVATCLSAVVSVLSAIQLVQAVKEGSANVTELYANFQGDVGGLVGNGISLGLFVAMEGIPGKNFKGLKGAQARVAGTEAGMTQFGKTVAATNGNTARGAAYEGLKSMGQAAPNLLSTKGMTRSVLTASLQKQVALGVGQGLLNDIPAKLLEDSFKAASQTATEQRQHGISAPKTAALSASIATSSGHPGSGISEALRSRLPAGTEGTPAVAIPIPEHSPMELNDIFARRAEVAAALAYTSDVRNEARVGISGGQSLLSTATEHEANACTLDTEVAAHHTGLQSHADQAHEGEEQAREGQVQTGEMGSSTNTLKSDAEDKQAKANAAKMPAKPEKKGFWDRIANWFQEKVFKTVENALNWVRELIASVIMKVVAFFMGVSDIEGKLAQAETDMQTSGKETAQSQAQNEEVAVGAQTLHAQASEASTDAQSVISKGEADVCAADGQEQALLAQDVALQSQADEVQSYTDQFEQEWGPAYEESNAEGPAIDSEIIGAFKAESESVRTFLDNDSVEITWLVADAQAAMAADAAAAGIEESAVVEMGQHPLQEAADSFLRRQTSRRERLDSIDTLLADIATMPAAEATAMLEELADGIQAVADAAFEDANNVRRAAAAWLAQVSAAITKAARDASSESVSVQSGQPVEPAAATT